MTVPMVRLHQNHKITSYHNNEDPSQDRHVVQHDGKDIGVFKTLALARRAADMRAKLLDLPDEDRQALLDAVNLLKPEELAEEDASELEEAAPEEESE